MVYYLTQAGPNNTMDVVTLTEEKVEKRLRKFTFEKLKVLAFLVNHSASLVSSKDIASGSGTANKELGGILSSLSRTKIDNEPIIIAVVRGQDSGMIWRFNESAFPKEEVRKATKTIIKEVSPYFASL